LRDDAPANELREPRNRPSRHVIASANLRKRLRAMIAALDRHKSPRIARYMD